MAIDAATINQQPIFSNLEDERQHRKERLAAAFRVFAKLGYEEGVMGHISARDPIKTDHYWTNPFGLSFGLIKASDLVLMSPEGKIASGPQVRARASSTCSRRRPPRTRCSCRRAW